MNTFGRTQSNIKRLKLKAFFKRVLNIVITPKPESIKYENSITNGVKGSGSGGRGEKSSIFRYEMVNIRRKTDYVYRGFNKPQLIGKLVFESGKTYRIQRKAKYHHYYGYS